MKNLSIYFLVLFLMSCENQNQRQLESVSSKNRNAESKNIYKNKLINESVSFQQIEKDKLWKQKGKKYLETGKYSLGMSCIGEAVKINEKSWKPYEAFAKCIYLKNYTEAIKDFEAYKQKWGTDEVEGHDLDFYLGICYLQNNELESAKRYLSKDKSNNSSKLFYLGIVEFKLKKYKQAMSYFDRALKIYPEFSDAKYYKSICLSKYDKFSEASILIAEAKQDAKNKFTLKESNVKYIDYPYQVKW